MDTLANLERVQTDNKDRPIEDLLIERTLVFVDPFTEVDEELAKLREAEIEKTKVQETVVEEKKKEKEQKVYSKGIGKFINPTIKKEAR